MRGHGPLSNAARAARTARSTSSTPASATTVIGSSVAGFDVVNVRPEAASTASPLMMSLPGATGARVSVMADLLSSGLRRRAPALDRLGVVSIVVRESQHHPAERMRLVPDLGRLVGQQFDALEQLLARGLEQAQRVVPR